MSAERPLDGRVEFVTGGGSGIGLAVARRLGMEGGAVIIAARGKRIEQAEAMIAEAGLEGGVIDWDLAMFSQYPRRFRQLTKMIGGRAVDFVSSAAVLRDNYTHRISNKDDDLVIKTNQQAPHRIAKELIPQMRQLKDGTITFISSIVGILGHELQANYAQAKAANIALARSIAQEQGSKGIRANAIAPGLVDTEIIVNMPERMRRAFLDHTITGELMSPELIADATLATILDKDINGKVVVVDDGFTAQTDLATRGDLYYIAGEGMVDLDRVQTLVAEAKAA